MTVTRPSRYPQVALTPGGNFVEPSSGVQIGGWATGALYPSADANWLWRQSTDWGRHLDATRLHTGDILATTPQRIGSGALTISTGLGVGLTATITAGGVYYGNGERIDLTAAPTVYSGGAALVFPAASTRYVHARPQPGLAGAAIGSSCGDLLVSASPIAAGYVLLLTVTTNATDITAATQDSGVVNRLTWAVEPDFAAGLRGTNIDISGSLQAATGIFAGDAGGGDTLDVTALAGGTAVTVHGSSGGTGLSIDHVGNRAALGHDQHLNRFGVAKRD